MKLKMFMVLVSFFAVAPAALAGFEQNIKKEETVQLLSQNREQSAFGNGKTICERVVRDAEAKARQKATKAPVTQNGARGGIN